jgi:hypothetical protein
MFVGAKQYTYNVSCFLIIINRKTKNTTLAEHFHNRYPSTQMYDRSFPGFCTGTSIKSGGVKYVKGMLHSFLDHILAHFYLFTFCSWYRVSMYVNMINTCNLKHVCYHICNNVLPLRTISKSFLWILYHMQNC